MSTAKVVLPDTMPPVAEPDPFDQIIQPVAVPRRTGAATGARGFWRPMLAVLIPLVLVIGGIAGADLWAKASLSEPIRDSIAAALRVPPGDVSVDLGGDLALVQLINGHLESVTVTAAGVEIAGAVGDARIELHGLPVDRSLPAGSVDAQLDFGAEALGGLIAELTGLEPGTVGFADRDVRFDTVLDLGLLGEFPAVVEMRPSAGPATISFAPIALEINGNRVPASDIRSLPVLGEFIAPSISSREYCVADQFPMDLFVSRFAVTDDGAALTLRGTDVVVDETLSRPGLCN